jgi:hypothetical protein
VKALLLTIIVEFFPIFFLMRRERKLSIIIFSIVAINMVTNPVANLLYPGFGFWEIESGVIIVETLLFALLLEVRLKKGFLLSLAANIPTIIISLLLQAI